MLHTPASFQPLMTLDGHAGEPDTFLFHDGQLLLRLDDHGLPAPAVLREAGLDLGDGHALGLWQGRPCRAMAAAHAEAPAGHAFVNLRGMFGVLDDGFLALAGRARQIADWARTHRYCGACAAPMAAVRGERAFRCPACGFTAYPRICPAMMVLIRKGDHVLLASHANAATTRYTALAGFVEAGESVEEAVHREVYEEVGLRVHRLEYFASQSWPFPNSLMIAFTAEYLDGEIRIDPAEIADARWFGPDDPWPETPHAVSIASALLAANRPGRPR